MVKKKHLSDTLTERKAYYVIEAIKDNCSDCRKGLPHVCCLQPLIKEWENKAQELSYGKKKRRY